LIRLAIAIFFGFFLARAALAEPSVSEMAGQMLMAGFEGDNAESPGFREVLADLESGRIGGVLFLAHNIAGRETLLAMTAKLKDCRCKYPPLIAIDEEGGRVERLTAEFGFTTSPSAAALGSAEDGTAVAAFAALADDVADAGFNLNLAPVADLAINPANRVIGGLGRSFGGDGKEVYALAKAFIGAHHARGVLTSVKHFPGHGSSAGDTHKGYADVTGTWSAGELVPYQLLVFDGVLDTVMIGHISNANWLGPATLAPSTAISGLLREKLGYEGVVISDDLDMGAVRANSPVFAKTIERAALAGNDILIIANHVSQRPHVGAEAHGVLSGLAADGLVPPDRIARSFARIMALKEKAAAMAR
jgi:beta-N-acetylhexosaminidase